MQWEPPHNCTHVNGYLYEYRYELLGLNNSFHILERITDLTTATFTNLMPHSQYIVKVFLVNSKGWSSSHPLEINVQTRATSKSLNKVHWVVIWGNVTCRYVCPILIPFSRSCSCYWYVVKQSHVKLSIFWDVASCSPVDIDASFRGGYCLHYQCDDYPITLITLLMEGDHHPADRGSSSPWWWRQ
jgi:hypothetical protein